MNRIDIGLLLPSSTIFPVAKDYENGLLEALDHLPAGSPKVNIIKEFVGSAGTRQVEDACNKLFTYDNVDVITGVVSTRVVEKVAAKFFSRKKPFIVSNVGGHVPDITAFNEFIYLNSLHLWKHAWSLGYWGVKQFGKKGMFVGSVYDAGYGFSQMFHHGMMSADAASEWSFSVPPMPAAGELTNMEPIFPFLEHYRPDFVFAAFCGAEATLFFNEFTKRGWHTRTKIVGLPFLLSPFSAIENNMEIYTTQASTNGWVDVDKTFYHLGRQAGTLLAKALLQNTGSLPAALSAIQLPFAAEINGASTTAALPLLKNTILAGEPVFKTEAIGECPAFTASNEEMKQLTAGESANWMNPYLCI